MNQPRGRDGSGGSGGVDREGSCSKSKRGGLLEEKGEEELRHQVAKEGKATSKKIFGGRLSARQKFAQIGVGGVICHGIEYWCISVL